LTESDKKAADVIMSDSSSPAQVQAAVKQMTNTAFIRLDSLNERYRTVMGENFPELLTPGAADAATTLGFGKNVAKYGVGGNLFKGSSPSAPAKADPFAQFGGKGR